MTQITTGPNSHYTKQILDLFMLSIIKHVFSLTAAVSHRQKCAEGHFACPSGNCISSQWLCDGEEDCGDGVDESVDLCGTHVTSPSILCDSKYCFSVPQRQLFE
uniref:Uncharacterized protein n=1 Tax=Sinocyclocheilus grahami TaxID=75366 RepID=A0A672QCK9_SINGR